MRELTLPDVIRHTALWSSDFPPRPCSQEPLISCSCQNGRGDRPAQLPTPLLYAMREERRGLRGTSFVVRFWPLAPRRFAFALNRLDPALPPTPPFLAKSLNLKERAKNALANLWAQRT